MAAPSSSTSCSLLRGPNRLIRTRQQHGSACETMQSEQLARPQGAWIRSKSESVCPHALQAEWPRRGEERCRRRRRSSGEPNGGIEYDSVVDPAFSLLACIMRVRQVEVERDMEKRRRVMQQLRAEELAR